MTIEATVIEDSRSEENIRLTTFLLRYPRFIHAEVMTHRVFSRNASSSRAIPVAKLIEDIRRDPAMPIYWGSNKPGMQAGDELDNYGINGPLLARQNCEVEWLQAMKTCIAHAEKMIEYGLHKQIANRILEPWAHINVVVTSTNYDNFYALRRHEDAQPEIKALADAMYQVQSKSKPKSLSNGQWHLPFVTENDKDKLCFKMGMGSDRDPLFIDVARKISVSRCARTSYMTYDMKEPTIEADLALYNRLVGSQPLHASPTEHQATPDIMENKDSFRYWDKPNYHGNFEGWIQYRKLLPNEHVISGHAPDNHLEIKF